MWVLSSPVVMMGMYSTWWIGPLKVMIVNLLLAYIKKNKMIIFKENRDIYEVGEITINLSVVD